MQKTLTFFTQEEPNGKKDFFGQVTATSETPFRQFVEMLKAKSRDIEEFLCQKGPEDFSFWGRKVIWEER